MAYGYFFYAYGHFFAQMGFSGCVKLVVSYHNIHVHVDGKSTENTNQTIPLANQAKSRGIHIFVVGITNEVDMNELNAIASAGPDDNPGRMTEFTIVTCFYVALHPISAVLTVEDFYQVQSILNAVVSQACFVPTTTTPPIREPLRMTRS